MAWQLVAHDLAGVNRAMLDNVVGLEVTPRLNGYASIKGGLERKDAAMQEVLIGQRAIRAYQDGVLRFDGKVWEPLSKSGSTGCKFEARSPLAEFMQRRVRSDVDYTATSNAGGPWDAGQIAYDRLAVQNGYRNSYVAAGTRQASANRIRSALVDTKEGDILDELAGASGGFFYRERFTDTTPGAFSLLDILYPSAGTNHPDVRFEYGDNTLDNLVDYEQNESLPVTRSTVSSSSTTGGRIAQAAENAPAITTYGLFEDSTSYSDISDTTLLAQQANATVKPTPPTSYKLTPGLDAPLLFRDFNVGDFVRLAISDVGVQLEGWVRVLEATLAITPEGIETLSSITVEILVGDQLTTTPDLAFIAQQDETRRRLEALERKVENLTVTVSTPPPAPAPSGGSFDTSAPAETPPPTQVPTTAPPPPAPSQPPGVAMSQAIAGWDDTGNGSPYVIATGVVTPFGQATVAEFEVVHDSSGAPNTGDPNKILTPTVQITPADSSLHSYQLRIQNLTRGTRYWVRAKASNASGSSYSNYMSFNTPAVRAI